MHAVTRSGNLSSRESENGKLSSGLLESTDHNSASPQLSGNKAGDLAAATRARGERQRSPTRPLAQGCPSPPLPTAQQDSCPKGEGAGAFSQTRAEDGHGSGPGNRSRPLQGAVCAKQ